MDVTKSCLKYHGGKSQLAKKHVIYEPSSYSIFGDGFVGSASYLCVKDRIGVSEYANDLYGEITNFYRVLQDDRLYLKLKKRLENTPFSQNEFDLASSNIPVDGFLVPDVDAAWAFFVRNRQSRQATETCFASKSARTRRDRNENVSAWISAIEGMDAFRRRMLWVEIRQLDILDFIDLIDSPSTFFYLDPPYLPSVRSGGKYKVEMSEEQHVDLLDKLSGISGKFMLCGYPSRLYQTYAVSYNWNSVRFPVTKSSSGSDLKPTATEVIWRNYVS